MIQTRRDNGRLHWHQDEPCYVLNILSRGSEGTRKWIRKPRELTHKKTEGSTRRTLNKLDYYSSTNADWRSSLRVVERFGVPLLKRIILNESRQVHTSASSVSFGGRPMKRTWVVTLCVPAGFTIHDRISGASTEHPWWAWSGTAEGLEKASRRCGDWIPGRMNDNTSMVAARGARKRSKAKIIDQRTP